MTAESLRHFFAWSAAINISVLLFWIAWMMCAPDFVYRIHTRWFKMSMDQFYAIHYRGIIYFKIAIFLFNVVPYLALRIMVWRAGI